MLVDSSPTAIIKRQSQSLRSLRSDEFLPPVQRWTRLGGWLLVATVGGVVALAAATPYHIVVKAPATVRPTGEIRLVQATTEGVVARIAVQENQVVQQGDPIAYLDDSSILTKKSQLQGNIQQSQQQLTQINAQIQALAQQYLAESHAGNRTATAAAADWQRSQQELRERQITTQSELQEATAELGLARETLQRYRQLSNSGAIAQLQVQEKEGAFQAALAKVTRAQAKINPSNAGVTMASEKIAGEQAKSKATLAKLQQEKESLIASRAEVENRQRRDQQALQQLNVDRGKSVVRATATGTILQLGLRNSNQVVRLGESIAKIAPQQSSLVIKTRLAAQDISLVKLCQQQNILTCQSGRALLRFSAYPYPDYGVLNGAVVAIAPDTTTSPNSPIAYYEVTIQPEKAFLTKDQHHFPLQAGMDVTAEIVSKQETILTFIMRKARLLTDR
jgi:HlyD family type I secretion membrane fusion protein